MFSYHEASNIISCLYIVFIVMYGAQECFQMIWDHCGTYIEVWYHCYTLDVGRTLLACQKSVHGCWHRLHVDLKQDAINSRANNTVV